MQNGSLINTYYMLYRAPLSPFEPRVTISLLGQVIKLVLYLLEIRRLKTLKMEGILISNHKTNHTKMELTNKTREKYITDSISSNNGKERLPNQAFSSSGVGRVFISRFNEVIRKFFDRHL